MKVYQKVNEDISKEPTPGFLNSIGTVYNSMPELVSLTREFYREAYSALYLILVKQAWIERQITFGNHRRLKRSGNGFGIDKAYNFFIQNLVGISQKPITTGVVLVCVPTYFKDFYPNFDDINPFENPDYYRWPYEHITIDFLYVVYEHHERIEMLKYADEKKMTIMEFTNFAYNQADCYNQEVGRNVYEIRRHSFAPSIKRVDTRNIELSERLNIKVKRIRRKYKK